MNLKLQQCILYIEAALEATGATRVTHLKKAGEILGHVKPAQLPNTEANLFAFCKVKIYFETGEFSEAKKWIEKATGTEFEDERHRIALYLNLDNKENGKISPADDSALKDAIKFLSNWIASIDDLKEKYELYLQIAILSAKGDFIGRAHEVLSDAISLMNQSPEAYYLRGMLLFHSKGFKGEIPEDLYKAWSLGHKGLPLNRYPWRLETAAIFAEIGATFYKQNCAKTRAEEYFIKSIKAAESEENNFEEGPKGRNILYRMAQSEFGKYGEVHLTDAKGRAARSREMFHWASLAFAANRNHYDIHPDFRKLLRPLVQSLHSSPPYSPQDSIDENKEKALQIQEIIGADARFDSTMLNRPFQIGQDPTNFIVQTLNKIAGKTHPPPRTALEAPVPELATIILYSSGGRKAGSLIADGGWILTCAHGFPALGRFKAIVPVLTEQGLVTFIDSDVEIHWIDHYSKSDYAICRIAIFRDDSKLKNDFRHFTMKLADQQISVGTDVMCIGHPGKDDAGEVAIEAQRLHYSKLFGKITSAVDAADGLQQVATYIRGGFSGGPVVDINNPGVIRGMPGPSPEQIFGESSIQPSSSLNGRISIREGLQRFSQCATIRNISELLMWGGQLSAPIGHYWIETELSLCKPISLVCGKSKNVGCSIGIRRNGSIEIKTEALFEGIFLHNSRKDKPLFTVGVGQTLRLVECIIVADGPIVDLMDNAFFIADSCIFYSRATNCICDSNGSRSTFKKCSLFSVTTSVFESSGDSREEFDECEVFSLATSIRKNYGSINFTGAGKFWQGWGHFLGLKSARLTARCDATTLIHGSIGSYSQPPLEENFFDSYYHIPIQSLIRRIAATKPQTGSNDKVSGEKATDEGSAGQPPGILQSPAFLLKAGRKSGLFSTFQEAFEKAECYDEVQIEIAGDFDSPIDLVVVDQKVRNNITVKKSTKCVKSPELRLTGVLQIICGSLTLDNIALASSGNNDAIEIRDGVLKIENDSILEGIATHCFGKSTINLAKSRILRSPKPVSLDDESVFVSDRGFIIESSDIGLLLSGKAKAELIGFTVMGCRGIGILCSGEAQLIFPVDTGENGLVKSINNDGGISIENCRKPNANSLYEDQEELKPRSSPLQSLLNFFANLFGKPKKILNTELQPVEQVYPVMTLKNLYCSGNKSFGLRIISSTIKIEQVEANSNLMDGFVFESCHFAEPISFVARGNGGNGATATGCIFNSNQNQARIVSCFNSADGLRIINCSINLCSITFGNHGNGINLVAGVVDIQTNGSPCRSLIIGNSSNGVEVGTFARLNIHDGLIAGNCGDGIRFHSTIGSAADKLFSIISTCVIFGNDATGVYIGDHRAVSLTSNSFSTLTEAITENTLSVVEHATNTGIINHVFDLKKYD